MNDSYKQQDIDQFFKHLKELPYSYEFEKVHQIIDSPNVKYTHKGWFNSINPIKLFIMSSLIIGLLISLIFYPFANSGEGYDNRDHLLVRNDIDTYSEEFIQEDKDIPENRVEVELVLETTNAMAPTLRQNAEIVDETNNQVSDGEPDNTAHTGERENSPWPCDTIINGTDLVITLTDVELLKLGFLINDQGAYYKNDFNGTIKAFFSDTSPYGSNGFSRVMAFTEDSDGGKYNRKIDFSNFDFYPIYLTDVFYNRESSNYGLFYAENDTLVPVKLTSKQLRNDNEVILWFRTSDALFGSLPSRYQHLKESYAEFKTHKNYCGADDFVKFEPKKIIDRIRLVELTEHHLKNLGFSFEDSVISFQSDISNTTSIDYSVGLHINSVAVSTINDLGEEINNGVVLHYVSDSLGKQNLRWYSSKLPSEEKTLEKFLEHNQILVPIILKQKDYPQYLEKDLIFWFEPSLELFSKLPPAIGRQLEKEYRFYMAETEEERKANTTSCVYFDVCKNTLDVRDFMVYPNPASNNATVAFSSQNEISGEILLLSITGAQLRTLVSSSQFHQGVNQVNINLSGIASGIYMVVLKTNLGIVSHRLIVN
jgi:hypothetical protein